MKAASHQHIEQQPSRQAAEPDCTTRSTSDALFVDNRSEAIAQRTFADAINTSSRKMAQRKAIETIYTSPYMVAQRRQLRAMFGTAAQLQPGPEDEELLQEKFAGRAEPTQFKSDLSPRENRTGMPDQLKAGIESLSGFSMDHVRVQYNSSQPAHLNALAHTQGTDIHVAPGQEQHLPHEAWHVVQQAQGRVQPTMQMKDGVPVNNEAGLEQEADVMGAKAVKIDTEPVGSRLGESRVHYTIQKKNRIDLSKVEVEKKEKIRVELEKLKQEKRRQKKEKTQIWASASGNDHNRDEKYNAEIEQIRKAYEEGVTKLVADHKITDAALISGDAYYGEEVDEGGAKFHRRSDTGKEYVKDIRGTFAPRYIRRELNYQDRLGTGITTQGISTLEALKKKKQTGPGGAEDLSWGQREFLQQSIGGGENLFALSHTSTKRPILSNDHKSFGEKPDQYAHSGAIITDLAKMGDKKFAAQWSIDKTTGHKVALPEGAHETLEWRNRQGSGAERDQTVRMSGYRNMEVVAEGVPKEAILQPDDSWKKEEGPQSSYHTGESQRGRAMEGFRTQKREETLGKLYWQDVEARYLKAQKKKPLEKQIPLAEAIKIDDDRGRHWKGELEKSLYWKSRV